MPLPTDLTVIQVTDTYADMAGNPVGGSVSFVPTAQLTDATGNVVFPQQPVVAGVSKSTGTFTVKLPCTDNSGLAPSSWAYTVEITVPGMDPTPFTILVPSTLGSSVRLRTVAPATPPAPPMGTAVYSVNGQSGAVVITPSEVGALPLAGGTMSGPLELNGGLRIPSGAASGDVLTSDSSGNATWGAITAAEIPAAASGAIGGVELSTDLGGTAGAPHVIATHLTAPLPINQGGTNSGTQNFSGLLTQTAAKTSAYTAAAGDFVCVDTTSAGVTITLPNAPADLTVVAVKMVASATPPNAVTIVRNPSGTDVFNVSGGSTSATLTLLEQSSVFQYQHSAGIWLKQTGDIPLGQADNRYRRSVSIAEYGALTSASDNGPAINAAITALGSRGGVVYIPPGGTYSFSTQLSLASATSVTIQGQTAPGAGAAMSSTLQWTGTGSGSAINAQNSNGVRFRDLTIVYNSTSFTGNLLDYRNVSGFDTSYGLLENCYIGGAGIATANILVNLDKCINMTIRKCNFSGAAYGVYGKSANSNYSNAVTVEGCVFHGQTSYHIYNAGQAWTIDGCTFESLSGGAAGAYGHDSGNKMDSCTFRGNWLGDCTGGTQFTVAGTAISFLSNYIGLSGGTGIYTDDVVTGLAIIGNDFVGESVALETVQPSGSNSATGWVIFGNSYTGVTSKLSGNFAGGTFYHDGGSQSSLSGTGLTVYGINMNGALGMFDGQNITTGGTSGTKIGTSATTQKLGFWNATPIAQPAVTGSAIGTSLSSLLTALANTGLIANSTSVPADLVLDSTAADIAAGGTQAAGGTGKIADAGHIHPALTETPADRGYLAWTYDPHSTGRELGMGQFMPAGDIWLVKIWLHKVATISTITLYIGNQIGTTLTSAENFAGLYDSGGTLRGTTADQTTNWTTTGNKNAGLAMSLTSAYTNAPAGFYWIALLWNGTGTPSAVTPSVAISSALNTNAPNFGLPAATTSAGLIVASATTLPSSITPGSIAAGTGGCFPFLAAIG